MALQKETNFKGMNANYWKILNSVYNAIPNKTQCVLGLYVNKAARDLDANNFLERVSVDYEGELSREELYIKLKESKMVSKLLTEATADKEATYELVESNPFAGALDV